MERKKNRNFPSEEKKGKKKIDSTYSIHGDGVGMSNFERRLEAMKSEKASKDNISDRPDVHHIGLIHHDSEMDIGEIPIRGVKSTFEQKDAKPIILAGYKVSHDVAQEVANDRNRPVIHATKTTRAKVRPLFKSDEERSSTKPLEQFNDAHTLNIVSHQGARFHKKQPGDSVTEAMTRESSPGMSSEESDHHIFSRRKGKYSIGPKETISKLKAKRADTTRVKRTDFTYSIHGDDRTGFEKDIDLMKSEKASRDNVADRPDVHHLRIGHHNLDMDIDEIPIRGVKPTFEQKDAKPIILASCGVRHDVAQEVANDRNRPVIHATKVVSGKVKPLYTSDEDRSSFKSLKKLEDALTVSLISRDGSSFHKKQPGDSVTEAMTRESSPGMSSEESDHHVFSRKKNKYTIGSKETISKLKTKRADTGRVKKNKDKSPNRPRV